MNAFPVHGAIILTCCLTLDAIVPFAAPVFYACNGKSTNYHTDLTEVEGRDITGVFPSTTTKMTASPGGSGDGIFLAIGDDSYRYLD